MKGMKRRSIMTTKNIPLTRTKKVLLTRDWSGHAAGEIVEEWVVTADSMIRKGYGQEYHEPRGQMRQPKAETADAQPAIETTNAAPVLDAPGPAGLKARNTVTRAKAGD
jgi:hypothetical protein